MGNQISATGTHTFLFTDISRSSVLWEQSPDKMANDVEAHNTLIKNNVDNYNGTVFKSLGDGLAAIFQNPQDAIHCAVDIQRAMERVSFQLGTLFNIKIAVHTGVSERIGDDYQGPAVNRIARIIDLAHPKQIIISGTSYTLAQDYLSKDIQFHLLTETKLRGSKHIETLYQPLGEGLCQIQLLSSEKTLTQHNLDHLPFEYIGKKAEREKILRTLNEKSRQIVSIVGFGGAGKTSLANVTGWDCLSAFPEGVCWVDCEHANSKEDLVTSTLQALGEAPDLNDLEYGLVESISARHILLIFDCFEGVVMHASLLERLLRKCANISILVTTRIVLGLQSETIIELTTNSRESIRQNTIDSIALFEHAAQKAQPDFQVNKANRPILRKLVAKVEYLPLAIVICAGRLRYTSLPVLYDQISQHLLDTVKTTRLETGRHAGLRSVIDSSLKLVPQQDLRIADGLAIFEGSFTEEAVREVFADEPEAVDSLFRLCDHSLVQTELKQGSTRHKMLDSVKEFLAESSPRIDRLTIRARHANYYLLVTLQAKNLFDDMYMSAAAEVTRLEAGNLRKAFETLLDVTSTEKALAFAENIARLYLEFGFVVDFESVTKKALQLAESTENFTACAEFYGVYAFAEKRAGNLENTVLYITKRAHACKKAQKVAEEAETWIDLAAIQLDLKDRISAAEAIKEYRKICFHIPENEFPLVAKVLELRLQDEHDNWAVIANELEEKVGSNDDQIMESIFVTRQLMSAYQERGDNAGAIRNCKEMLRFALIANHVPAVILGLFTWLEILSPHPKNEVVMCLKQLRPYMNQTQKSNLKEVIETHSDYVSTKTTTQKSNWKIMVERIIS